MADQIPERQVPKAENLQPKIEPEKSVKISLGQAEQTIVVRAGQDDDEDKSFQDVVGSGLSKENKSAVPPAWKAIFEGVYDQIRQGAYGKTPKEKGHYFTERIAEKVPMHIGEIESQNLTNQAIYEEIWKEMSAYIMRYDGTLRFEEKKKDVSEVYSKLTGHINRLVKGREVDPLTAKVFARYLKRYKRIGEVHYNAIVVNNQELPEDALQQKAQEYADAVGRLVGDYQEDAKEQESGGFIIFNADKQTGEVTTRIYVKPDLAQSPAQVLDAWHDSLTQAGLVDKIYFKVPVGLSKRQEGIVVYLTDQANTEDVEKLLSTFLSTCSQGLLSSVPMPSAVPITRGIAIAPELGEINSFLRYSGVEREPGIPETISYNEWVASSIQLAFELAYHKAIVNGTTSTITPKILKETAGGYFEKIVKLSGINPDTMVQNALGGKLPSWANKIAG